MLDKMLPALERFHPDLLIISSGFDAHYDDMYHYLTEQDYHWMTEKLCSVAENNGGKVISVLEGGYSLSTPVPSSKLHKKVTAAAIADNKIYTSIDRTSSTSSTSTAGKFAQEPGDGGLVKSVLAHTAALSGLPHWHTEH